MKVLDRLVGEHVRLLVPVATLGKGTICVVRNVLTYRDNEMPEDPLFLEHGGARVTALRRDVEELETSSGPHRLSSTY